MIAISDVVEVDRHRADYGDLAGLMASMRDIGQLQPIVVTKELRLVAGGRRLAAARSLGWSEIEAKIATNLNDAALWLRAEGDENTCRKQFTPTEEHSLYEALLALDRAAREHAAPVLARTALPMQVQIDPAEFSARTRGSVAELITGVAGRYKTLEKIGDIKRLAVDANRSERVRDTARQALEEIDRTGNISGSHTRVMLAKRAEQHRRTADPGSWSDEEQALHAALQAGRTVVVSLREHHASLVRWARAEGKVIEIDRSSEWGNPFELPYDGDRATVIRNYAEHYLPHKPSLLGNLRELKGRALACWCAPEPCHGDVLRDHADALQL